MTGARHKMLIGVILVLMLVVTLVKPSNAYASTLNHTNQHTPEVAYDHGYNYFFNAGWWGGGLCISHERLQSLEDTGTGVGYVGSALVLWGKVEPRTAAIASLSFGGLSWLLNHIDRGNGICIAWAFYQLNAPWAWAQ